MKTAIVILNWNGLDDTLCCLTSLAEAKCGASLIVVDNGSSDDSVKTIREAFPDVELIETGCNLGYAAGNNVGIRKALDSNFDVIGVLNNDTIAHKEFLKPLEMEIMSDPANIVVSPVIKYLGSDRIWFAGARFDSDRGIYVHASMTDAPVGSVVTPALTGCAIFAHRALWERVGLFDEDFFLIFEDADWSQRVVDSGGTQFVVGTSIIEHAVSSSFTGPAAISSGYYYVRNGIHYLRTNRRSAAQRRAFVSYCAREALRGVRQSLLTGLRQLWFTARGIVDGVIDRGGPHGQTRVWRSAEVTGHPLRIAMSSYYLPSESKIGAGYQAHRLAEALARAGHEVTVFSPCVKPEGATYDHVRVGVSKPFATFRWAFALRRQDFSDFDVFHAAGDDYWLMGKRRPVHVRTMHGSCFAEALHIRGAKARLRMVLLGFGEVLATFVADRTVLVSEATRRWYPWVRTVIPNGVDLAVFHAGGLKEDKPTVLFVGTYRNRKRGSFLAEIFEREILSALPSARLWMVCDDAPDASGVEVLGRISEVELADRYRRAWIFCLPSTYEGFGVPYIEALASGLPVVASPNDGAREVLVNGRFGAIVEDDALGAELIYLLKHQGERANRSSDGIRRAQQYSWPTVAAAYESLYRTLLTNRRRSAPSRR